MFEDIIRFEEYSSEELLLMEKEIKEIIFRREKERAVYLEKEIRKIASKIFLFVSR